MCQGNQNFFNISTLNVIWRLATGQSFDYEDPIAIDTIEHIEAFTMEETLGFIAGVSVAKHIPPFRGIFQHIKMHMQKFKDQILQHLTEIESEDPLCYVTRFHDAQRAEDERRESK